MQKSIYDFMCNKSEKNGLMLIDCPTGYGKTYIATENIYNYIYNNNGSKKIFFLTTLIKNFPIDELRKIYEKNGKLDEFDKDVFIVKSNYDYVCENLSEVNIPDRFKTEIYNELKENINTIKQLKLTKQSNLKKFIQKLEKDVIKIYEPNFRKEIENIIKKELPKNKNERKQQIKNNKEYSWIGKIYPTVFMDEYKIYMITIKKFLVRNTTFIEPSYEFIKSNVINDSIIFIDEFDATKDTVQEHIISNAINSKNDYIKLFEEIYNSLKTHKFSKEMVKSYENYYKNNNTLSLNELKQEAKNIHEKYYLQYSYKTVNECIDKKQTFLFNENSYHTIVKDNFSYIRTVPDKKERRVKIYFETKEEYYKNKSDNDIYLFGLISEINVFLNKFKVIVHNWAEKYAISVNKNRKDTDDTVTKENALTSIYKEFSLSENEIALMLDDFSTTNKTSKDKTVPDMSFYENGFKYFEFVDRDSHLGKTEFSNIQFFNTPEKIILSVAQKAKVIGISATSTLDTVIGNYDISYLSKNLKNNFKTISNEVKEETKKDLEERWVKYRNGEVNVNVDVLDFNKGNIDIENRLEEIFKNKTLIDKYRIKLNMISNQKYILQRYCNNILLIKKFLENENIQSLLCLNMILPDNNKPSFDLNLFNEVFEDLCKEIGVDNCKLKVLKSMDFNSEKDNLLKSLGEGEKIFIFSSYKTIGAGQNLQYKIPKNSNTIQIYNSGIKDDKRMYMKDIDAIYLGDITNIVSNIYDLDKFNLYEMMNLFFHSEYLYQNNEISYSSLTRLIKQGFKSYSNNREIDISADKSLRNSKSVRKNITRDVMQAVGRICRTFNKNPNIYIFMCENVIKNIDTSNMENIILSPEIESIIECKNILKTQNYSENEKEYNKYLINESEKISLKSRNYILNILSTNWDNLSIKRWHMLRECVLKYPTASGNENNDFNDIIDELYIKNKNRNSRYLYAQRNDFSEIVIDYDRDKTVFLQDKNTNGKNIYFVSEEEARLQNILKYPKMKEHFEKNGWATTFGNKEKIFSPVLFNNIYKGVLGEVAGKFILEQELGIKLKEISDTNKFEVFDYELSNGIYIDFKHWKNTYNIDRYKAINNINEKLKSINGKKVLIINIISDNAFGISDVNNGQIVEIARLIDSNGNIDYKSINYIREVLKYDIK